MKPVVLEPFQQPAHNQFQCSLQLLVEYLWQVSNFKAYKDVNFHQYRQHISRSMIRLGISYAESTMSCRNFYARNDLLKISLSLNFN